MAVGAMEQMSNVSINMGSLNKIWLVSQINDGMTTKRRMDKSQTRL